MPPEGVARPAETAPAVGAGRCLWCPSQTFSSLDASDALIPALDVSFPLSPSMSLTGAYSSMYVTGA